MAQPYFDQLRELMSAIGPIKHTLVCKHFFSGAALSVDQKICASLTPQGLAFKLPKPRCDQLIAQGKAKPLRYFEKSPIKQGYILLSDFESHSEDISSYFRESMVYVGSIDT